MNTLLIIAQHRYQDIELAGTIKGMMDAVQEQTAAGDGRSAFLFDTEEHPSVGAAAGLEIMLASKERGICTGKFGGSEEAQVALRDVVVGDEDRIAFIGGPGAEAFVDDPEAHRVAREAIEAGIPLGAICIAPTILAAAGLLNGKKATVWDDGNRTQISFLERHGAIYSGENVTVDGLIITGNGPGAAEEFGRRLAGGEDVGQRT